MPRRRLAATAAALALLAAAPAGHAADDLSGGVLIDGSAIKIGVYDQGTISGRFANGASTFYCCSNSGLSSGNAQYFAVHAGGTVYTPWAVPFTPVSPPALSGTGTAGDPWLATSVFDAGSSGLRVTHVVRHVDGSRAVRETFTVANRGAAPVPFEAFVANDLYVAGIDSGQGELDSGTPRVLSGVANDGTKVSFVEVTPWAHYYEGHYMTSLGPMMSTPFTYPDTIDPSVVDNGLGVEWNHAGLAPGATATFTLQERFSVTGGVVPQAPVITAAPVDDTATSASVGFAAAPGDTAAAAFECSLDGAAFDLCTTPVGLTGLTVGAHGLRVRAINIDGDNGPSTTATWNVLSDTTAPAAPAIVDAPPATTTSRTASIVFTGENGAAFACRIDGGAWEPCVSPLKLSALALGTHVVEVRQTDAAANTSVAASAAWQVIEEAVPPAPPAAPTPPAPQPDATPEPETETDSKPAPPARTRPSVAAGATTVATTPSSAVAGCALDGGAVRSCRIVVRGPGGVVVGTGFVRVAASGRQRVAVEIKLTAAGKRLANRPGGVRARVDASILPAGAATAVTASTMTRIVPPRLLVVPTDLAFAVGSDRLSPAGRRYLASVRTQLRDATAVTCFGYTDSHGSEAFNEALALRRATAVCATFGSGRAVGIGERTPRASNRTAAGRALNRRVELLIEYR